MVRLLFLVALGGLLTAPSVSASSGECRTRTGNSAVLILPATLQVTVDGRVLESNVGISAFTPGAVCAGTASWKGANEALVLWGDDSQTTEADGFASSDPIALRFIDEAAGREYTSANARVDVVFDGDPAFFKTSGGYQKDGVYRLASVTITTDQTSIAKPAIPTAVSPVDGATNVASNVDLVWTADDTAPTYLIQVSTESGFGSLVVSKEQTEPTLPLEGLRKAKTYYWRIRASNAAGTTSWSPTYQFRTGSSLSRPIKTNIILTASSATLTWDGSPDASSYQVQLAATDAFEPVLLQNAVNDTVHTVENLQPNTTYYWRVQAGDGSLWSEWSPTASFTTSEATATNTEEEGLPRAITLSPNYPNPFNPTTTIPFELPSAAKVRLVVYNMLGVEQAVLVDGQMSDGRHEVRWNAVDVPSGAYVCRLEAGDTVKTITLMLVK